MIALKRLNGTPFILNCELIESIDTTPDTVVKLASGKTVIVQNSVEDIVRKIVKFKQLCNQSITVNGKRESVS